MSTTGPARRRRFDPAVAHALDVSDVVELLGCGSGGLDDTEAERRRAEFGANVLPEPQRRSPVVRYLSHFRDVLILVLLGAAVLTAVLREWLDTAVILGVVVINATIGFVQEGRAEKAIEGIRRMLSPHATVRRDGLWEEVPAEDVVPGDLVRVRAGDRVPADLRLASATNLRIEESALTGESQPSAKCTEPRPVDTAVGDRENMAYSGTIVTQGRGEGVVTATGAATELGRISAMVSTVEKVETPLTRQMTQFGTVLSLVILVLSVALFAVGFLLHGRDTAELVLATISFAVAAIPEGLPAILTITLAVGVQKMARRSAITRKLTAVETLGSVTVICSDKTGTLTRNEMTARRVVTTSGSWDVDGVGYAPEGHLESSGREVRDPPPDLVALVDVMGSCNDARLVHDGEDWRVHGDPTEGALLALAARSAADLPNGERLAEVPFESENKFMGTLERRGDRGDPVVLVKGAPERLLERSSTQVGSDGSSEPLEAERWHRHAATLARDGMRVLAGARRTARAGETGLGPEDLVDLEFVGLVGILDPPRPEAIEAIGVCHDAGIAVKMITGDHVDTASAIGAEMGIGDGSGVISGTELEVADDDRLVEMATDHDVFARTSPEHKLRIVTALQAAGHVVAMTGDGVNDAPALARADVGVAMGRKGTEATKEAAEIVLADDNFETIRRAIEAGRTIHDNLRKSITFILPTNGAQALVMLVAVVAGLQLPLTPVQILWVNMVTAVTLALALAFEPTEPGVMSRPPRAPGGSILDRSFLRRLLLVSIVMGGATVGMFLWAEASGASLGTARTMALNTLVVAEVFYLFNARFLRASSWPPAGARGNRAVWIAVGVLAVLQLGFVYVPFMNTTFGSEPVAATDWIVPLLVGTGVFVVVEVDKAIERGRQSTSPAPGPRTRVGGGRERPDDEADR